MILKTGVALYSAQLAIATTLGVMHPERIRLLAVDIVPPTNRLLRSIGRRLGFVSSQTIGMTLRYGIFIKKSHWGDRRLLAHEFAHVAQYERLGGFSGFLGHYLEECIHPGYPMGDLELEAKQAERDYCRTLSKPTT